MRDFFLPFTRASAMSSRRAAIWLAASGVSRFRTSETRCTLLRQSCIRSSCLSRMRSASFVRFWFLMLYSLATNNSGKLSLAHKMHKCRTKGDKIMINLGFTLSGEEFGPRDLVRFAVRAEEAGFGYALISDHFHPWLDEQGHSPFVWVVIGAVARATKSLRLGTGVTCPIMRIHPAVVAQAAATSADM